MESRIWVTIFVMHTREQWLFDVPVALLPTSAVAKGITARPSDRRSILDGDDKRIVRDWLKV